MKFFLRSLISAVFFIAPVYGGVFSMPEGNDKIIGQIDITFSQKGDTLIDIARRNDLGFDEMVAANASVDVWLPRVGSQVNLPHRYLLPDAPYEGIVVNTAEMRMYYFPKAKKGQQRTVESFPISIGRSDWNTPLITTKIVRKTANPIWYPPKSIRVEHARDGDPLPAAVKSGPDNPLGLYALYLGIPSYLIHGTNKEFGIGMQVTHGCMRLYPEDIKHLYEVVKVGTPLRIVNQPYKVGWSDGILYLEIHQWLEGTPEAKRKDKTQLTALIKAAIKDYPEYPIDWQTVDILRIEASGMPEPIGPRMMPLSPAPLTRSDIAPTQIIP